MVGGGGEAQIVPLNESTLLMTNMRTNDRDAYPNHRMYTYSHDKGTAWASPV